MKIVKITTEVKSIELKTPFRTALRETSHVEFVRVEVECEGGLVGIGEASASKVITGEDIYIILTSIASVEELFFGLTCKEALEVLHVKCAIGSSAKAALDIAFTHLIAQEAKKPLYEYFGATDLSPLKSDITISLNEVDVMLKDAKEAFANGMEILKVKVGDDVLHAVDIVRKISAELPECEILVDANQAWNFDSTILFIENMLDTPIKLIEQPLEAPNLDGLKRVSEISHIPILADEAVFTLEDAQKIMQEKCADMINVKLMKCGGVSKAVEILEFARNSGFKCMLGSMLEGPYSINMALHLAFAYRDVIEYVDLDSPLLYKEMPQELDFVFNGCEIKLL